MCAVTGCYPPFPLFVVFRAITLDLGEFATIVSADWMFGGKFAGAGVKT